MKNTANLRYKKSKVEKGVYKEILHIVILQIALSIIGALYGALWLWDNKDRHTYIQLDSKDGNKEGLF